MALAARFKSVASYFQRCGFPASLGTKGPYLLAISVPARRSREAFIETLNAEAISSVTAGLKAVDRRAFKAKEWFLFPRGIRIFSQIHCVTFSNTDSVSIAGAERRAPDKRDTGRGKTRRGSLTNGKTRSLIKIAVKSPTRER